MLDSPAQPRVASYGNCPVFATDVPQSELNRFMNSLEAEIRGLYGAPF